MWQKITDNPVQAASVVIACLAFFVTLWSAYQSRRTSIANIIAPLMKEFGDDEMFQSLRELRKYYEDNAQVLLYRSPERRRHSDRGQHKRCAQIR
jgi:hypothetical protein